MIVAERLSYYVSFLLSNYKLNLYKPMVIYLMRHTAVDVPQGVCYGQTDVPLKPTFETEATQTAANLQGLSFDKVYTSPLTRCVRLATFAATRMQNGTTA